MWCDVIISVQMSSSEVKLTSVQVSCRSIWPKWSFKSILLRSSLLMLYKYFSKLHLHYAGVTCDQPDNILLTQNKIKSVQYNTALEMSDVIKGWSRKNIYEELGLESLEILLCTLFFQWLHLYFSFWLNI